MFHEAVYERANCIVLYASYTLKRCMMGIKRIEKIRNEEIRARAGVAKT